MMQTLDLAPGATVWADGVEVTIVGPADMESVLVRDADQTIRPVPITALSATPPEATPLALNPELTNIPQKDWDVAHKREGVLRPLLEHPRRTSAMIAAAAAELGCVPSLVYRLLARYKADPRTTSLLPHKSGKPLGLQMVPAEIEKIMTATIEEFYLTRQNVPGKDIADEVRRRCRNAGVAPPGVMTVYRRLKALPPAVVVKARRGSKAARDSFLATVGSFPETGYPLQVIQIDHTPVDAIVVDQIHRKPIGRPWLTLAIDVHTRMVAGFLLSLDPPQATSVALCLVHAVVAKEDWLARRKIEAKWPVWGKPDLIHVDNGKEFHSEALTRGCAQYGIDLKYRPVRTPRYGGHIERLIGTVMGMVHLLPGTTFSNIGEKGDYDSEKHACMTLPELEEWMAVGIDVYHRKIHSALGIPPITAWEQGILGTEGQPGRGLPARIADPERFLIDFLPLEWRTISREGVQLFRIQYWSDVLRPLVKDGNSYLIRYDPRDLSRIWFLSKDGEYYPLSYRTRYRPSISLWEHDAALAKLRAEGRKHLDEAAIFDGIERMRAIVDGAASSTKKARRQAERRRTSTPGPAEAKKLPDNNHGTTTPVEEEKPRRPVGRFEVEEW